MVNINLAIAHTQYTLHIHIDIIFSHLHPVGH